MYRRQQDISFKKLPAGNCFFIYISRQKRGRKMDVFYRPARKLAYLDICARHHIDTETQARRTLLLLSAADAEAAAGTDLADMPPDRALQIVMETAIDIDTPTETAILDYIDYSATMRAR